MQSKWFLSQQSKQKQNKIKIGVFTTMFLMQYFCLCGILLFSKSCNWNWKHLINYKEQGKKVFWHVILHSYLCNAFNIIFFPKHSEIKRMWPINSSKQEIVLSCDGKQLFVQYFVKVFDQNQKHVEVWTQRTGTPTDFTVPW